ncbi:MAG: dipeptidase, partial [Planctomycetota bacterium]
MPNLDQITAHIRDNRERFEQDLFELLKIPSVSTDSQHAGDVRNAGNWVAEQFRGMGLEVEIVETERHPIVLAETPAIPGKPTVLVYGHYDVQPPDPLDEWNSPPFEPTRKGENVVARGATDDKGQMLTHVMSARAWKDVAGEWPVQLKFLIEGEEEIGSANLYKFLETDGERLKSDIAVISDTSQFGPGQPAITYGLKGIAYYELYLEGPSQDLHSGTFGGSVMNPAIALSRMLGSIVNEDGQVQIPGFYDDVIPLSDQERKQFSELSFSEEQFKQQVGVDEVFGEAGYTTLERRWARPTYDVNGLTSGYQGEGAKTVLPAKASAKFSFRLVPDQDPKKVTEGLRQHLESVLPTGIRMNLVDHHGAAGFVYDTKCQKAIERVIRADQPKATYNK